MPKPIYYIKHMTRKGLFCVRNLHDGTELIYSASQIYENQTIFPYLAQIDARYIQEVVILESED